MIKLGSMFAGIGGIDKGFEKAGCTTTWANEIDHNACITYRMNNLNNIVEKDIYKITDDELRKLDIDVLAAGFPCQAFSIAGYRKGFEDERGVLFYEVIRVIQATKPLVVFCENVKNLVTHDYGNTYNVIKTLLQKEGYKIYDKVMNSCEYGNLPQNRERIYIVAVKQNCGMRDTFNFPDKLPLTKTIYDVIDIHNKKDNKYYYNNTSYFNILNESMDKNTIYQIRRTYVRENKSNLCPTLTANMGTGGHNVPIIRDDYGIRKLTPYECFKFQGMDDYKLPSIANSHLYKQAGNSVSVPVIERIAKNIIELF